MFPVSPINFLDHHESVQARRRTVHRRLWALLTVAGIAVILSSHRLRAHFLPAPMERAISQVEQISFFHLAQSSDQKLQGEENGRINIVLMGIGGGNHDGPLLTDTLILASIDLNTKRLALVSIPRDMVVPQDGGQWRKINAVLPNAEARAPGTGDDAVREKIQEITNQPIPYYIRMDFDGFVQLVDAVGGITIDVDRTVDDYMYPIDGQEENPVYANRFEHLVIPKGPVTMDGALALKYVRSRHALGPEGSDFARSKRQQKVLLAIKHKVFSYETIFSPRRLKSIEDILANHIATNLQPWEVLRLRGIIETVDTANIIHPALDDSPQSLLMDAKGEDGAFILVPRSGNFNGLVQMEANLFSSGDSTSPASPSTTIPSSTLEVPKASAQTNSLQPSIALLNGTTVEGYATRIAKKFESAGIALQTVENAPAKGYEESVLYVAHDVSPTDQTLQRIEAIVPVTVTTILPSWAANYPTNLILVLGSK